MNAVESPEPAGFFAAASDAPRELRPVVVLLLLNLAVSIILTVATLLTRHSIVNYQLDHRHIHDPAQRRTLRDSYTAGIVTRAVANVVVSVVYVFLVRALFRGRRWAYRRVVLIAGIGIVGLLVLQSSPYPTWMRVEQLLQALILAGLLVCVLRPEVRSHLPSGYRVEICDVSVANRPPFDLVAQGGSKPRQARLRHSAWAKPRRVNPGSQDRDSSGCSALPQPRIVDHASNAQQLQRSRFPCLNTSQMQRLPTVAGRSSAVLARAVARPARASSSGTGMHVARTVPRFAWMRCGTSRTAL